MKVFTKKHAVVGFVTLKALSRYLDRKRNRDRDRRGAKIAFLVTLAIVSLGVFAALAYFWRQQSSTVAQWAEDVAGVGEPTTDAAADTVAEESSEMDATAMEPSPAT